MAYLRMSRKGKEYNEARAAKTPTKFQSRNVAGTSPLKEQFAPTEQVPVPQRYKMGGGA